MTADLTPAPDLGAWLTELEVAHAAATAGPWQVMNGDTIATGAEQLGPGSFTWSGHIVLRMDDWRDDSDQEPNEVPVEDDAALIVAAVNALPRLVAAVRRLLDGADELNRWASENEKSDDPFDAGCADAERAASRRIRSALTAAMTPEGETTP